MMDNTVPEPTIDTTVPEPTIVITIVEQTIETAVEPTMINTIVEPIETIITNPVELSIQDDEIFDISVNDVDNVSNTSNNSSEENKSTSADELFSKLVSDYTEELLDHISNGKSSSSSSDDFIEEPEINKLENSDDEADIKSVFGWTNDIVKPIKKCKQSDVVSVKNPENDEPIFVEEETKVSASILSKHEKIDVTDPIGFYLNLTNFIDICVPFDLNKIIELAKTNKNRYKFAVPHTIGSIFRKNGSIYAIRNEIIRLYELSLENDFTFRFVNDNLFHLHVTISKGINPDEPNVDPKRDESVVTDEIDPKRDEQNICMINIHLDSILYPFYPPKIRIIQPKYQDDGCLSLATMDLILIDNWKASTLIFDVIMEIKKRIVHLEYTDDIVIYSRLEEYLMDFAVLTGIPFQFTKNCQQVVNRLYLSDSIAECIKNIVISSKSNQMDLIKKSAVVPYLKKLFESITLDELITHYELMKNVIDLLNIMDDELFFTELDLYQSLYIFVKKYCLKNINSTDVIINEDINQCVEILLNITSKLSDKLIMK